MSPVGAERAVVIVSGGDAVTPFTTPDQACRSGLAAGNTATALREALLDAGHAVYTAPTMNARTAVREPSPGDFGAFGDCPAQLPAEMTIVSQGEIDDAGEHLARFVEHLNDRYGVTEVDWVGHSNGGLFALAATRVLRATDSPVSVTSLTALGTPWMGANPLRIIYGEVPESECRRQESCLEILETARKFCETRPGLAPQNTRAYLLGEQGWHRAHAGALDGVPALLVAGTALDAEGGDPEFWPNDGLVSEHSALAAGVGPEVIPLRRCESFPLLHSIYIADALGKDWQMGLTWNAEVLDAVTSFVAGVRRGEEPADPRGGASPG